MEQGDDAKAAGLDRVMEGKHWDRAHSLEIAYGTKRRCYEVLRKVD